MYIPLRVEDADFHAQMIQTLYLRFLVMIVVKWRRYGGVGTEVVKCRESIRKKRQLLKRK